VIEGLFFLHYYHHHHHNGINHVTNLHVLYTAFFHHHSAILLDHTSANLPKRKANNLWQHVKNVLTIAVAGQSSQAVNITSTQAVTRDTNVGLSTLITEVIASKSQRLLALTYFVMGPLSAQTQSRH